MSIVRWETPPKPPIILTNWREVARELRANPGQWGIIYEGRNPRTVQVHLSQLRGGRKLAMSPASDFEYARDGLKIYGRYSPLKAMMAAMYA